MFCDDPLNTIVLTICDWLLWFKTRHCGCQVGFLHSADTVQLTVISVKLSLLLYEVDCFHALWNETFHHSVYAHASERQHTQVKQQGLCHMSDWVDGSLSPRDRRLASQTSLTTRNLLPWHQTYCPYHTWKWIISTMLELEEIIAVWALMELKRRRKMRVHAMMCDCKMEGFLLNFLKIWEEMKQSF